MSSWSTDNDIVLPSARETDNSLTELWRTLYIDAPAGKAAESELRQNLGLEPPPPPHAKKSDPAKSNKLPE